VDEEMNNTVIVLLCTYFFMHRTQLLEKSVLYDYNFMHDSPHCCFCSVRWKNVSVRDICLLVYSHWISCEEEAPQVKQLLCVCIGATSIREIG